MPIPSLSVVLPAYNEALRLPQSLERLNRYVDEHFPDAELIVADDGSSDATAVVVSEIARSWPRTQFPALPHRGKGHAVKVGMLAARGSVRLFSDVDLAVPPEFIERFVRATETAEVVIGSRDLEGSRRIGEPRRRRVMGRIFNASVRLLASLPYSDTQCGFKALRGETADRLFRDLRTEGFGFDVELLFAAKRAGVRVAELPVDWNYGPGSTVRWHHPSQMIAQVVVMRLRAMKERGR